ncbi:MAG: T9SS type A sorting domain-containing protein, partial [Candidatus Scalindua sp.]
LYMIRVEREVTMRGLSIKAWMFLFSVLAVSPIQEINAQPDTLSLATLLEGVEAIYSTGAPGPLIALSDTPVAIAGSDEDSSPPLATVVMASFLESGRVIAFGHEGFFVPEGFGRYDNRTFILNAFKWLDRKNWKQVLITEGHQETLRSTLGYVDTLRNQGYEVTPSASRLDSTLLSQYSVLFISNAAHLAEDEIAAIVSFVEDGGGLLMVGVGWSWPFRAPPGETLDTYPMNLLGTHFGIRYVDGVIFDPTNNENGSPVFHTFYPNIPFASLSQAFRFVNSFLEENISDLCGFLRSNPAERQRLRAAHLLVAEQVRFSASSGEREEIYRFYQDHIAAYDQYFSNTVRIDPASCPSLAEIKAQMFINFTSALPLTPQRKEEIIQTLNLAETYEAIFDAHSVLVLDNGGFNSRQLEVIRELLDTVPSSLHILHYISQNDNIAGEPRWINFTVPDFRFRINIFDIEIGIPENSFPSDISPGFTDVFSIVLVHELNHVVDAFYVEENPMLKSRRDALIAAAGENSLNYLRSFFEDDFFIKFPQEFFASISNQWFTDSRKTVELGIERFKNGYKHPINQALFFADVYSLGSDSTLFYRIDTQANIERYSVALMRNERGQITELQLSDTLAYEFELDTEGNVTTINVLGSPTSIEQTENELPRTYRLHQNYPNPFNPDTKIQYELPKTIHVKLEIFNMLGQKIRTLVDEEKPAGAYAVLWDGRRDNGELVASGVYIYRLRTDGFVKSRKLLLLR